MRTPLPPVAAVIGFIDAINQGDVDRLAALMSPGHRLQVLQEPPVTGREANRDAWNGYVRDLPLNLRLMRQSGQLSCRQPMSQNIHSYRLVVRKCRCTAARSGWASPGASRSMATMTSRTVSPYSSPP